MIHQVINMIYHHCPYWTSQSLPILVSKSTWISCWDPHGLVHLMGRPPKTTDFLMENDDFWMMGFLLDSHGWSFQASLWGLRAPDDWVCQGWPFCARGRDMSEGFGLWFRAHCSGSELATSLLLICWLWKDMVGKGAHAHVLTRSHFNSIAHCVTQIAFEKYCVYIYIYIQMCTSMCVHICTYIYAHIFTYWYIYICKYTFQYNKENNLSDLQAWDASHISDLRPHVDQCRSQSTVQNRPRWEWGKSLVSRWTSQCCRKAPSYRTSNASRFFLLDKVHF